MTHAIGTLFSKDATPPYVSERYQQLAKRTAIAQQEFPYDIPFLPAVQIHALVAHSVQYRITDGVLQVAADAELLPTILRDLEALQRPRQEGEFKVKGWFAEQIFLKALARYTGQAFVEQHQEALLIAAQQFPRCQTALWTPERARAALSEDIVWKRTAASAFLWDKWCEMQTLGKSLTLHQLKLWRDIEVYQDMLNVPAWFVDSLHLSGILADRHQEAQKLWNQRLGRSQIQDLHGKMRETMRMIQKSLQEKRQDFSNPIS